MLDEGGNKLDISRQISKTIELDWGKGKRAVEKGLMNGELPSVTVPEKVSEGEKKYTVTIGKNLQFSFYVRYEL